MNTQRTHRSTGLRALAAIAVTAAAVLAFAGPASAATVNRVDPAQLKSVDSITDLTP